MNYYKHHIGDYQSDTSHLSWEEDLAYRRIIDVYYKRELPMPIEVKDVCRLVRAVTKAQQQAVETVLQEFFELLDDGWHQKRCDEELARFSDKSEKAKQSALSRWKNEDDDCGRNADEMRTHSEGNANHKPITNNHKPITNKNTNGQSAFDRFWEVYPKKVKKITAHGIWKRKKLDSKADEIITDVQLRPKMDKRWKDGFVPDPTTYLNQERWNDEVSQ